VCRAVVSFNAAIRRSEATELTRNIIDPRDSPHYLTDLPLCGVPMYRLVVCVNSVRHSTQPMDATHRQHLPFIRRVVRLRHSPHHLRAVPPLGPQLPRSRLRQFSPPFNSVKRGDSHATLPVLPLCRTPWHSPHHLRELPPSGPHLPRSRPRQFCPPFDPANRRNSHATLPVLPACRPPSA